jgi:hypothetical protein
LKQYLTIDIEFPNHWKIPKRLVQEDKIVENDKVNDGFRFFSFVSEFNENELNVTVENIKNIVAYNKEIEMKWIRRLRDRITLEIRYRKKLKELRKRDPFIYK